MFRFLPSRLALAVVVAGVVAATAGCADSTTNTASPGGDGGRTAARPPATASASPAPSSPAPVVTGPHNDIDTMVATAMIPHHRQAVEMADLAATRAGDQRVKDLAARIRKAQEPEVTLMSAWLTSWGRPVPAADAGHTSHGLGMMTHAEMEDLTAASGRQFDRMFLDMMIRHHQGAIEMATAEQHQGVHPGLKKLTADIIATQTAEINQMRDLLTKL